jgi:hypothetical protein
MNWSTPDKTQDELMDIKDLYSFFLPWNSPSLIKCFKSLIFYSKSTFSTCLDNSISINISLYFQFRLMTKSMEIPFGHAGI